MKNILCVILAILLLDLIVRLVDLAKEDWYLEIRDSSFILKIIKLVGWAALIALFGSMFVASVLGIFFA